MSGPNDDGQRSRDCKENIRSKANLVICHLRCLCLCTRVCVSASVCLCVYVGGGCKGGHMTSLQQHTGTTPHDAMIIRGKWEELAK